MTSSPSSQEPTSLGVHLVGSAPFPSTSTAFREYALGLPSRLRRIPDGETGERHYFTAFQAGKFFAAPEVLVDFTDHQESHIHFPIPVSAQTSLPTFLAPLTDITPTLMEKGLEVYPGVVQFDDEKGTRERIAAVTRACPGLKFGVATECGWGRTPEEQIGGIMKLLTRLSSEVET